ncbi:MAG TPA: DnaT-like ssDNA-binding domain-containing protein [Cellvibrionaceae bacterium]
MTSSLIPEQPLLLSPSLAATIGLEEALLLSCCSELAQMSPHSQALVISAEQLAQRLPFWPAADIQRIATSLHDKGIINLTGAPFTQSAQLSLGFAAGVLPGAAAPAKPKVTPAPADQYRRSNLIAPNWQPDRELMAQIAQHSIPDYFIRQQVPEFVTYWRERGEPHHAWGAKFLKHVLRQWREHESGLFQREQDSAMHPEWRPSDDAMVLLVRHAGINQAFVEDAIPEYVLYWQERGELGRTWNSKFIQHVKRQWARFTSALEHDTEPRRLPDNWQPGEDVYDVLRLANINLDFARRQLPEFILFWRDSNRVHSSWNTKFLQHVKHHWARQHALATPSTQVAHHAGQQQTARASTTRDRSLAQDLTDRSWAS